jgi:hypothetical protein
VRAVVRDECRTDLDALHHQEGSQIRLDANAEANAIADRGTPRVTLEDVSHCDAVNDVSHVSIEERIRILQAQGHVSAPASIQPMA